MLCERCGKDMFKHETCNFCNKKICNDCMKSSKKKSKVVRSVICKDCWSKIPSRKAYKATVVAVKAPEYERRRY
jgi:hypothetical protein